VPDERCRLCGTQPRTLLARFRFAHEPRDSPAVRARLLRLEAAGIELDAEPWVLLGCACGALQLAMPAAAAHAQGLISEA
jgi:hypothetical protein